MRSPTVNKKTTISTEELQACAKAASKRAVERAEALKIPYTVQQGRDLVEHRPDGTTKIVGRLPKAYVKPAVSRYHIARA
jgi:hypothetical protein